MYQVLHINYITHFTNDFLNMEITAASSSQISISTITNDNAQ